MSKLGTMFCDGIANVRVTKSIQDFMNGVLFTRLNGKSEYKTHQNVQQVP